MAINKKNRSDLKSYFVKNAIPTESQFSDLIDGVLNQVDDGIFKLPDDPLSIVATGGPDSQKKAIQLYETYAADATPAWVLSLNPRADAGNPATARPGFSISDNAGTSRLFIDKATGNVGIGTTEPTHAFHVRTGDAVGLFESTGTQAYLRFASKEGMSNRVEIANRPGGRLALWTAGGGDAFNITRDGKVGIGVTNPAVSLDVNGGAYLGYATSISDFGAPLKSGFYQSSNATGDVPDTSHSWSHLLTVRHSNTGNNHQLQIAASYAVNNRLFFRKIAAGNETSNPDWNEVATCNGNLQILRGGNALNFTSAWSGSPDRVTNVAEISNDTNNYKTLMIIGNRSAGRTDPGGGRRVSVWDILEVNGDLSVTRNVNISGVIVQESWQSPGLLNGWVNYSDSYNSCQYFKDSMGIVHLKGLVKNGSVGKVIFNLPAGYRPLARQLHAVCTNNNTIGRCDVGPGGNVFCVSGNNGWFSLDGITFRAHR